MEDKNFIFCPLVDEKIENVDCVENRDVADGMYKEDCIPPKCRQKEQWKDICKNCKWHNY